MPLYFLSVLITSYYKIKLMPELKVQRFEDRLTAQSVLFEANVFGRAHNFHSKCFSGLQNCNELRLAGK